MNQRQNLENDLTRLCDEISIEFPIENAHKEETPVDEVSKIS